MSAPAYSIAVVCESDADCRIACALADRVLLESINWLETETLDSIRNWRGLSATDRYLAWKHVRHRAAEKNIKIPHGHFDDRPGEPDAAAGRRALWLLKSQNPQPDAVLLIRDSDGDTERRAGLEQARLAHRGLSRVVIGVAHTKRECWVLNGFAPFDEEETQALENCWRELGFCPVKNAEELTASQEGAKRDAKRIHRQLLKDHWARESKCWNETPLNTLSANGSRTGLAHYLDEVRVRLAPMMSGR